MEVLVGLAAIVGLVAIVAIVHRGNFSARADRQGFDFRVGKQK